MKFVIDNWRLVKTGTTQAQRRLFFNLHREQNRLARSGMEADTKQLAAALNVKEKEVASMLERFNGGESSLDRSQQSGESGERPMEEWLGAAPTLQPDVLVETAEFIRTVRTKVEIFGDALQGRELVIFRQRFVNEDPPTLAELSVGFGVSRERTRQLEDRLRMRLRDYLRREMGDAVPLTARDQAAVGRGSSRRRVEARSVEAAA